VGGVPAQAEDRDPQAETLAAYERMVEEAPPATRDVAQLRQRIAVANLELSRKLRELNKTQAELEYTDPLASKLREELRSLEKATQEARRNLAHRLAALPEVQAIQGQREALVREIQEWRRQERALLAGEGEAQPEIRGEGDEEAETEGAGDE